MIRFSRRPLPASEFWNDDEALPAEFWHMSPRWNTGRFEWTVQELKRSLTTDELAHEILIALVEYYKRYRAAFRTRYREFDP